MTEPSAQRPVPGPPRPGAASSAAPAPGSAADQRATAPGTPPEGARLAGLDGLPVAEHVAVFEAEHERLQRELGTIDPL